jgi:hypothetical protein
MMQHQNGADPADKRPQYDMGASEIERFQAAADDRLFNTGHGLPLAERDYTVKSWGARRPQRAQLHCLNVECAERSLAPRCRSRSDNTGRAALPEQSVTYGERHQPYQPGQAEAAKCGRRTEVAPSSERSAARLAHQSGGLGVASSNLAAPTNNFNEMAF